MQVTERKLSGVFEVIPSPISDERGYFVRTYAKEIFSKYNIHKDWVQENCSRSIKRGIIRGLHFQFPPFCESKLIRCISGAIFDVYVDLRENSHTFGQWESVELSEDNKKMIFIPRGFAHGFCTLADKCDVLYKVDSPYNLSAEGGIIWNDKTLNINWPISDPFLSERDIHLMTFEEFVSRYGGI
jgi:dTDP-4-dehydrorhamnose 3,5-epimerase